MVASLRLPNDIDELIVLPTHELRRVFTSSVALKRTTRSSKLLNQNTVVHFTLQT